MWHLEYYQVLGEMEEAQLRPDRTSYNMLLRACRRMQVCGIMLCSVLCAVLRGAAGSCGELQGAVKCEEAASPRSEGFRFG